jgi:hypothetical protein
LTITRSCKGRIFMLLSPIEINNLKFTKYFVLCFKESRKIKTPIYKKSILALIDQEC